MKKNSNNIYYLEYERILVAVDCIIFGFDEDQLKILLFKRRVNPFSNRWSLIGSFVRTVESVSEAAKRTLQEYTGLCDVYMDNLNFYGALERDPGSRVISLAHYALIPLKQSIIEGVEHHQAQWFNVNKIPSLILDHNLMVSDALKELRQKARYRPIGFELLPQKFTIPQLKTLYDSIYQKTLDQANFRKKILSMNVLEKLDEKDKFNSKRGAYLYRFDRKKYKQLLTKGFNFEL